MRKGTDDDATTPFIRDAGDPAQPPTGAAIDPYRQPVTPGHKPLGGPNMFGSYAEAKKRKVPKWAAPLLIGAAVIHLAGFVGMWIQTIWQIDILDKPEGGGGAITFAPPPPPPPPPPAGGVKPQTPQIVPKKMKVRDITQPIKIEKQQVQQQESADVGDPDGEEGGVEGGVAGGVAGGVVDSAPPPPPPPPPPPAPPQNVAPQALEASRISGNKMIVPDDVTKTEIGRSGKSKIVGAFKLCLSADGNIASVNQIGKGTGFPAYDSKIVREMRTWRYRPFMVNGKAVPVCTAVTFIYSQK